MKKILFISISIMLFNLYMTAQQSIDAVLAEVEKNNTTLVAFRKSIEATQIGNKMDIYLQNPEIEFNYLWGNPGIIGNRTDFKITQSFDFPTAYSHKSQISDLKNEQSQLEYKSILNSIRLDVKLICIELVYLNALHLEMSERIAFAERIADLYKKKFDTGETSILEFNKAQLNLLNINQEIENIELKRNAALSDLASYNGGQLIDFSVTNFPDQQIPADFESWFNSLKQRNPELIWLNKQLEISQKQVDLNKAMALPKLNLGYMNESVVGQKFSGITIGVSVPLFENKNKVQYAVKNTYAIESNSIDRELQIYNHLKSLYNKAIQLETAKEKYSEALSLYDNSTFLNKSLDAGDVSLIEYILEQSYYYENFTKLLDLEKELSKTIVELNQYN